MEFMGSGKGAGSMDPERIGYGCFIALDRGP